MDGITLVPTCDPNVFFCPENNKMYVSIRENELIKYVSLVKFFENPQKYKLLINGDK